jgi:hypothetical protein
MVFLYPGLNGTSQLFSIHLTTHTGDSAYAYCLQGKVIFIHIMWKYKEKS